MGFQTRLSSENSAERFRENNTWMVHNVLPLFQGSQFYSRHDLLTFPLLVARRCFDRNAGPRNDSDVSQCQSVSAKNKAGYPEREVLMAQPLASQAL